MKLIICLLALTFFGCSQPQVIVPWTCVHPGIRGGQPFQVPANAAYNSPGVIWFTTDTGEHVELRNAICIRVTK